MPKYVYFCEECEGSFEIKHSLQKTHTICELCGIEDRIERKPSAVFISKKDSKLPRKNKAGELLKATIEDSKQELRNEQARLKNRKV